MKKLLSMILTLTFVLSIMGSSLAFGAPKKTYVDGTYKATYDYIDSHGWKSFVEVTIKGDKITAAKFDYINPAGKLKSKDAKYNKSMKAASKTKTYPALYTLALKNSLIKTQNIGKVDSITGATTSSNNFKTLAKVALANAKKGNKTPAILVWNDTYTATEAAFDSHGWKGQVSLTYAGGKLTKVDFDELDKDGKKKSEDTAYNDRMRKASKNSMDVKQAIPVLTKAYLETGKADVVTGATSASGVFKTLVEKAAAMRK